MTKRIKSEFGITSTLSKTKASGTVLADRSILKPFVGQTAILQNCKSEGQVKANRWLALDVELTTISQKGKSRVTEDGISFKTRHLTFDHLWFEPPTKPRLLLEAGIIDSYQRQDGSIGYTIREPKSPTELVQNLYDTHLYTGSYLLENWRHMDSETFKKLVSRLNQIDEEIARLLEEDKLGRFCLINTDRRIIDMYLRRVAAIDYIVKRRYVRKARAAKRRANHRGFAKLPTAEFDSSKLF